MIRVSSKVKLNMPKIKQLSQAQIEALEQTAEALHTEVVQAEVMPRDTGTMQNESTFVDYSRSASGKVSEGCTFIRSIIFKNMKMLLRWGSGMSRG